MKSLIGIAAIHSKKRSTASVSGINAAAKIKEENVNKMYRLLEEAGRQGADIVATPECFEGVNNPGYKKNVEEYFNLIEEIPGPISDRIGAIAKKYDMNVVANYLEKDNGNIYNTSILIDRKGKLVGKYRKIHLPPSERWTVTEGNEFTVLKSDVGNIGFATCYDIKFPEQCRAMALNGADIIFHQTEGWGFKTNDLGEALVRIRAAENSVYMVVAKNIQSVNSKYGKSCIISNSGQMLAEAGGEKEMVVMANIEPDYDCISKSDFNALFSGIEEMRARDLLERRPSMYRILAADTVPLNTRYNGKKLPETEEDIKEIYDKFQKYKHDIENNIPVDIKYHW